MIKEQLHMQPKFDEANYPSRYDQLVERASRDERVGRMAAHFVIGDFRFDQAEVLAIATEYSIFPNDVTERACLSHIVRKIDEVTDGEA